jgi:chromate transporter
MSDTSPAAHGAPPAPVPFREALRWWFKLGFISFGGPAGQIAVMHQELVERRRWVSESRFLHALNYCMVLPGPEAQQLATYIGWLLHGVWGGIAAGALFVLPSLVILIALSWIYLAYGDVPAVAAVLYGVKPAVTAIVAYAAYRIGTRALKNGVLIALAAAAFVAIFVFDVPFPAIVLAAGLIGAAGGLLAPDKFRTGGLPHGGDAHSPAPRGALIDDHSPPPDWVHFRWARVVTVGAVGLGLWAAAQGALLALYGWEGVLTQMGWFFTKAALVTFGGAYAVLPYVYQGGVEHYQWLTAAQMIDGLALGETTPGPLIMVVAFVGFVGGWTHAVFGPDWPVAAGVAGAAVATFFTFLPSFLFILIGAPLVEATRHEIRFTAPLAAITAAVVGVVVNLAVFFAYHVLWPPGWTRPLDPAALLAGMEWFSLLIGLAAFAALVRWRAGIVPVIGGCAAAGLLWVMWLEPWMSP